jgi:ubiquinone/menaquinone biosynthesis C-methylase UbiE
VTDESPVNQELFQYYNERAPEYEDFYRGEFVNKVPDPTIYQHDTANIQQLLPDYVKGACLDIACGTGFWLPFYQTGCTSITLIDQSAGVLAECAKKIKTLSVENKTHLIQNDIFSYPYAEHAYDTVVAGFLISHFKEAELARFFNIVKSTVKTNGALVIIDSVWSKEVAVMSRVKSGLMKRLLKDGREFEIYKTRFEKTDLQKLAKQYSFKLEILYWGKVFFLARLLL